MSKNDMQLKQDVEEELRWDPKVNETKIGISVHNGAVSLAGVVGSFAERRAAEDASKRVGGMRVLADELTVTASGAHKRGDADLAEAVLHALAWDVGVPKTVTAKIQGGCVTLEGCVAWNHQRESATRAVANLKGLNCLVDAIKIEPTALLGDVIEQVRASIRRQATTDTAAVHVAISGSVVTLSGAASSWREIGNATSAAWSVPGVTQVIQNMKITSDW